MSHAIISLPIPLNQALSLNLEIDGGQQAPGALMFSVQPQHTTIPGFSIGPGGLNMSPHACVAKQSYLLNI